MKAFLQKHRRISMGAVGLILMACTVAFYMSHSQADSVSYKEGKASTVTMEQTVTAAGELRQYKSKKVRFDTDLSFQALCVEVGDAVKKGDPLILYTDGSTTDAPANGVVTKLSAPATGDSAESSDYILVACTDQMILTISVPEDEINRIQKGAKAEVVVNADITKSHSGRIVAVQAIPEEDSGEYTVKLRLKNDGNLKIGMSASCTIIVSSRKDVLAVPIKAVQFDAQDRAYVTLIRDGQRVKRTVTTGESDANYVEVTKGLTEGNTILVEE